MLSITALYAIITTVLLVALGAAVSAKRAKTGVSILHGDDMALALSMRRHGNLAENAAMMIVVLAIAELGGASATWLHVAGIAFVVGRIAFLFGLSVERPNHPLRGVGATGNAAGLLIAAALCAINLWG